MDVFALQKWMIFRASVGLFCSTPGIAVVRSVPRKVSALMLLTGDPISAQGMVPLRNFFALSVNTYSFTRYF